MERAKNQTKSTARPKVEQVFGVMELQFGFVKVPYRGLVKNANRLFATCALVNLFMVPKNCCVRWRYCAQKDAAHCSGGRSKARYPHQTGLDPSESPVVRHPLPQKHCLLVIRCLTSSAYSEFP